MITSAVYLTLVFLIVLWAARYDISWLSPERVFSSTTVLIVPAGVIFTQMLHLFARIMLWKALVVTAISHFIAVLVADFAILGF